MKKAAYLWRGDKGVGNTRNQLTQAKVTEVSERAFEHRVFVILLSINWKKKKKKRHTLFWEIEILTFRKMTMVADVQMIAKHKEAFLS